MFASGQGNENRANWFFRRSTVRTGNASDGESVIGFHARARPLSHFPGDGLADGSMRG